MKKSKMKKSKIRRYSSGWIIPCAMGCKFEGVNQLEAKRTVFASGCSTWSAVRHGFPRWEVIRGMELRVSDAMVRKLFNMKVQRGIAQKLNKKPCSVLEDLLFG